MLLAHISGRHPVCENIRPRDFFDLYSLLYSYQTTHPAQLRDMDNMPVITKRLKEVVDYIYEDHMTQLAKILLDRTTTDNQYLRKLGASFGARFRRIDKNDNYEVTNAKDVNIKGLIPELLKYGKTKQFGSTTSGNGTWSNLLKEYLKLLSTGTSLQSKIMTIDKIYAMLHHGGNIIDHMDESHWLEDALNTRANVSNVGQLLKYASSDIQELLGSAEFGVVQPQITTLQKIATSLNRAIQNNDEIVDIHLQLNNTELNGEFIVPLKRNNTSTSVNAKITMEEPTKYGRRILLTSDIVTREFNLNRKDSTYYILADNIISTLYQAVNNADILQNSPINSSNINSVIHAAMGHWEEPGTRIPRLEQILFNTNNNGASLHTTTLYIKKCIQSRVPQFEKILYSKLKSSKPLIGVTSSTPWEDMKQYPNALVHQYLDIIHGNQLYIEWMIGIDKFINDPQFNNWRRVTMRHPYIIASLLKDSPNGWPDGEKILRNLNYPIYLKIAGLQ